MAKNGISVTGDFLTGHYVPGEHDGREITYGHPGIAVTA
jgi:hypothetical protein